MSVESLTPEQLLNELGITEPEEIDLEAIAEHCSATIVYEPLAGCEARILGYGDRSIITVNSRANRGRQRFSGAHELGHWMRDRGKIAFACDERMLTTEWWKPTPERRANQYAVDLLLPPSMFKPRAAKRSMTFETVRSLADLFQTSLTATALRLVEFGSYPAILVCTSARGRVWFKRGPNVPEILWPTDEPGRGTTAYRLLHGREVGVGPVVISADELINHVDAHEYVIKEDSVPVAPELVLSLVWWEDEGQLLDLESEW